MRTATPANIINHIGMVLDASSSMQAHAEKLIQAADAQIKHLATRSTELDQETRISVWTFSYASQIDCVVWDKDVLRLPSIRPFYLPSGMTALVDGTLRSIDDLDETPQRYGDHSFLVYVLTDGQENNSKKRPEGLPKALFDRIARLPDNWTLAALVPDTNGVHEAKRFGFPAGNIERWDTASATGATEAGERIRQATDSYMTARASGVRSTTTLFSTGADAVNDRTVKAAGLTPLRPSSYLLIKVGNEDATIRDFAQREAGQYVIGRGYYELTKAEDIQPGKDLAFMSKTTGEIYVGPAARALVNLPPMQVRVKPDHNLDFRTFVQSTSTNRRLKAGTQFLYLL